jgi:glycosyltransferase involved in cell wall biosynthesis
LKLSACIIVKNEPLLAQAVASIRKHVDEVVIVDTGSEDTSVARSLADTFEVFTDCNDELGQIADFAMARQRSFDLAAHENVLWLDADDEVVGLENLKLTQKDKPVRFIAPYEYVYNDAGDCIKLHKRERIVLGRGAFQWERKVHEGLRPRQGFETEDVDLGEGIVWKHRRAPGPLKDKERNLRILRTMSNEDPRTLYDLGVECYICGLHEEAIEHLGSAMSRSLWPAERFQSCMLLVDILMSSGNVSAAKRIAHRAIDVCPNDPEGYFALAKIEHAVGEFDKASFHGFSGLSMPTWKLNLLRNPLHREIEIPAMVADSAAKTGNAPLASAMIELCLKARPTDPQFLLCKHDLAPIPTPTHDVVIVCGKVGEAWNPDIIKKSGMGGSETAVVEMSKRLVARGCRVRVFCDTPIDGLFDGVEYRSHASVTNVKSCDILIAWREATSLSWIAAKSKWIWVHDTFISNGTPWQLHLADRVLALSQWHAKHLMETAHVEWEKLYVTANGIDLSRFEHHPVRHRNRALYTSSPDRGLTELLDAWPQIRAAVPDAELRVFYGWEGCAVAYPEWTEALKARVASTPGVTDMGRVDQKTLAFEMLSAGAWLYPSIYKEGQPWLETSCISAMEAQAAGLHVVAGRYGALVETVRSGELLEYGPNFIEASIDALSGEIDRQAVQSVAKCFSWDAVVDQWIAWMEQAKPAASFEMPSVPVLHMVLAPHISGELPMDPHNPQSTAPTGGCRDGFLGLVKAMGRRNDFHVRAFATFADRHTLKDGIEYVRIDEHQAAPKPDALLAYYDTSPLIGQTGMLRIGSHHTYAPHIHFEWTDVNTAPSQHTLEHLRNRYDPFMPWALLPNGVEIAVKRKPVKGRVVYHTSPDRGLHLLLSVWPEIRRRHPEATLHVTGKVTDFCSGKYTNANQKRVSEAVSKGVAAATDAGGLTLLGRLSRNDLDNELAEASVFAFPCEVMEPCETFSVSIMECLAIGLPVVLKPADALGEIYDGAVSMASTMSDFTDRVCEILDAPNAETVAAGLDLASHYTFDKQAEVLAGIINLHRSEPTAGSRSV